MIISNEVVEGIFKEEKKHRFLSNVLVEGKMYECYIPSASKLKNYLNMKNKKVLLLKNKKNDSRTQYSVFAVMYYNKYIILNLSIVNRILEEYLNIIYVKSQINPEKYIENYKADFLVSGEKSIIVEAKGIIASRKIVKFPTVHSQRAIDQLEKILKLLKKGWEVQYFFISLSPIVNEIKINNDSCFKQYVKLLYECIEEGMILKSFNVCYENNEINIGSKLSIIL